MVQGLTFMSPPSSKPDFKNHCLLVTHITACRWKARWNFLERSPLRLSLASAWELPKKHLPSARATRDASVESQS